MTNRGKNQLEARVEGCRPLLNDSQFTGPGKFASSLGWTSISRALCSKLIAKTTKMITSIR